MKMKDHVPVYSTMTIQENCPVGLEYDPTSVSAMLRGKGDGREKLFRRFEAYWQAQQPELDVEAISQKYERFVFACALRVPLFFGRSGPLPRRLACMMMRFAMLISIYDLN